MTLGTAARYKHMSNQHSDTRVSLSALIRKRTLYLHKSALHQVEVLGFSPGIQVVGHRPQRKNTLPSIFIG